MDKPSHIAEEEMVHKNVNILKVPFVLWEHWYHAYGDSDSLVVTILNPVVHMTVPVKLIVVTVFGAFLFSVLA
jgi:hypothetical protein